MGSKQKLGLIGKKARKTKVNIIEVDLSHNERFMMGALRRSATEQANAITLSLWERIGDKIEWNEEELEILSEAGAEAKKSADKLAVKCPQCSHVVFGQDPDRLSLEPFLYEKEEDGSLVEDDDGEFVPLISERTFRFTGHQHKMVCDILTSRAKDDKLEGAYWPLYKKFVGLPDEALEDEEDEAQLMAEEEEQDDAVTSGEDSQE